MTAREPAFPPPVLIAHCPEHGTHGERTECFVCAGPVEQVPLLGAADVRSTLDALIAGWRTEGERDPLGPARFYVDAFQQASLELLGELRP